MTPIYSVDASRLFAKFLSCFEVESQTRSHLFSDKEQEELRVADS